MRFYASMKKLYCYVDESGQDAASEVFVVVAVISLRDQGIFRQQCLTIEHEVGTGNRKWHKTRPERRLEYLEWILKRGVGKGGVFFGCFQKPLPYFLPLLETIEQAVANSAESDYQATVYIDGIDQKKAAEMTNALRLRGVRLRQVRSRKDEAEPLIRLADMWAGCVRAALLGRTTEKSLLARAMKQGYLKAMTKNPSGEEG